MNGGGKIREVPFAQIALAQQELRGEIEAVNWLLRQAAENLPAHSATAKAISRRTTWEQILRLARWEGAFEVVSLLEDAKRTLGNDLPSGVGMN